MARWRRCAVALASPLAALAVAAAAYVAMIGREETELRLMRFFRDLSRHKARQRLTGESGLVALSQIVTGRETLLEVDQENRGVDVTPEELAMYDGSDPALPLYLAIKGRVYDVTAGREYYGPGRSYHHFVGRDATRAFCTGCSQPDCLVSSLVGLDELLKREVDRWVELYEFHDKYKFIGMLIADPVEAAMEKGLLEETMLLDPASGRRRDAQELTKLGSERFAAGDTEDAQVYLRGALVQLGEHREAGAESVPEQERLRARVLSLLASLAQKRKEFAQAIEHYQEALDVLGQVLSEERWATSELRGNIVADQAAAWFSSGQTARALEGFAEARAIYERALDDAGPGRHVLLGNTMLNQARALASADRKAEAIEALTALVRLGDSLAKAAAEDESAAVAVRRVSALADAARDGLRQLSPEAGQGIE